MPQIFHPSTNTLSRLTIFGALGIVLGLLFLGYLIHAVSVPDAGAGGPPAARAVFARAPRARAGDRLPLLPHVGRDLVVCGACRRPTRA